MGKYQLEQKLDNLLTYMVNFGVKHATIINRLPIEFRDDNMVQMLLSRGFIQNMTTDFPGGPVTFPTVISVTPAGVWFAHFSGFVAEAKQKSKEQRRYNFEGWKLGWDSVVSLSALLISLFALYISSSK